MESKHDINLSLMKRLYTRFLQGIQQKSNLLYKIVLQLMSE